MFLDHFSKPTFQCLSLAQKTISYIDVILSLLEEQLQIESNLFQYLLQYSAVQCSAWLFKLISTEKGKYVMRCAVSNLRVRGEDGAGLEEL